MDGASVNHYHPVLRATYIGYLPQQVHFFNDSITQNIARIARHQTPRKFADAAQKVGAHEMILHLPKGYGTMIGAGGMQLSDGQMQKIGLACALCSGPVNLILDEPNSNLDNAGTTPLNRAVRQMKAAQKFILILAHRPAAIEKCSVLLVLDGGRQTAFGHREKILASDGSEPSRHR